ncbi:MAG: hypothetical protein ACRERU_21380 [Methylococcales bacterium]
MSDAIDNPISEHLVPVARTRRRADSPPAGFEPELRTKTNGGRIRSGVQSHSGQDRLNFIGIEQLPRDVGWMLFGVGFAGVIAPGVFGLPFMVAGGMILWPKTTQRLHGLLGAGSPEMMNAGINQVLRFLDDLERRYPRTGKP